MPARKATRESESSGADSARRDVRLNFLLQDVARLQKRAFDEFMGPLGVSRSQWLIVATLSRHDGMNQTQLASMLDVAKANLGTLLERLRKSGLIERATHPLDGRAKSVFLSKKGHQLLDRMRAAEKAYTQLVLRQLDDTQRTKLAELLALVKDSLEHPAPR